jgi:hypothetical protein
VEPCLSLFRREKVALSDDLPRFVGVEAGSLKLRHFALSALRGIGECSFQFAAALEITAQRRPELLPVSPRLFAPIA